MLLGPVLAKRCKCLAHAPHTAIGCVHPNPGRGLGRCGEDQCPRPDNDPSGVVLRQMAGAGGCRRQSRKTVFRGALAPDRTNAAPLCIQPHRRSRFACCARRAQPPAPGACSRRSGGRRAPSTSLESKQSLPGKCRWSDALESRATGPDPRNASCRTRWFGSLPGADSAPSWVLRLEILRHCHTLRWNAANALRASKNAKAHKSESCSRRCRKPRHLLPAGKGSVLAPKHDHKKAVRTRPAGLP